MSFSSERERKYESKTGPRQQPQQHQRDWLGLHPNNWFGRTALSIVRKSETLRRVHAFIDLRCRLRHTYGGLLRGGLSCEREGDLHEKLESGARLQPWESWTWSRRKSVLTGWFVCTLERKAMQFRSTVTSLEFWDLYCYFDFFKDTNRRKFKKITCKFLDSVNLYFKDLKSSEASGIYTEN